MLVYVIAFALTIVFTRQAAIYYNKILAGRRRAVVDGSSVCYYNPKKSYRVPYCIFFLLAVFPLFFIAAVRYDVGTDYNYTYVPNFIKILNGEMPYSEWGFNQLNRFIQLFTSNPQWLFVVTAFIYSFLLIQTIVRYSPNVTISIIVAFVSCVFFVFLNNMRQLIAAVILLRSYPYLKRGAFFEYLFCILVACLFHVSVIIMIIPAVAVNLKFIRRRFLLYAVLAVVLLPVVCKILQAVLMNTKYRYFFISHYNNGNATSVNILYNFVFFVLSYMVLRGRIKTDKSAYVLLCMQFFAFWMSTTSLFISISEMISRATVYFQIFQVLLIPYCVSACKDKMLKNLYLYLYIILYGLYLVYYIIMKGYHDVLPYQWIF